MKDFFYNSLSCIAGSSVAGVLLFFIIKQWLGTEIEQRTKHGYDRALEEFKNNLILEQNELINKRDREIHADSKLLSKFLDEFPPRGTIQVIRMASGRIFYASIFELLDQLTNVWKLPDHSFFDADINRALDSLLTYAQTFANELSANTFPKNGRPDLYEIPLERKNEDYENYQQVLNMIYAYRDQFIEAYVEFVKIARSKLGFAFQD